MRLDNITKALSRNIEPFPQSNTRSILSAVMIIIYEEIDEPHVIMTKRPTTMLRHAGEISFPGGKWSPTSDVDLLDTAIRETHEEIDLLLEKKRIIGQLDTVSTQNSGFSIVPFVATLQKRPEMSPNHEIEKILELPLFSLLKTKQNDTDPQHHIQAKQKKGMYMFRYRENTVWGASARILKQINDELLASD